ncbi:MAG: LON peptidase substrate-binding domain-containing protein, partial [Chloroflexi bacterium]|nr:LON peptidase substrate-binding domain-containing protein [Chloroflexota bacterium]
MSAARNRFPSLPAELGDPMGRRADELYQIEDAPLDSNGCLECSVLPLRDVVLYPNMVTPLFVSQESTLRAIDAAARDGKTMVAVTQLDPETDTPGPGDFYTVGTEVAVGRQMHIPDGSTSVLTQGRRRIQILELIPEGDGWRARGRPVDESADRGKETTALMRAVRTLFEKCVQLNRSLPEEAYVYAVNIEEPGWLGDLVASALSLSIAERQDILETFDPIMRLQRISVMLGRELDVLELEDHIHSQVQSEVDRSQREMYLREQLKAIQTELGEADAWALELNELRERVSHLGLPEEVEVRALKEISRLSQMPPLSPEVSILRTYLDWLLGQPILCFVGAPGTGKTSIGRSIAEALGRKFIRLSLGGIHDEAEIRGHRRTYIGALPGRILQAMHRAEKVNPLFMLDEIDKLGHDFRGDPTSALLEVLDPEQNHAFSDHYLELAYDLSRVMFITTANTLGNIPPALLDRLEVIEFPGYIEEEKLIIAHKYLVPRQLEQNGLADGTLVLNDAALRTIIREYTWEAGVRNLEREIGKVCRKIARRMAEGKRTPRRISPAGLGRLLGPSDITPPSPEKEDQVGMAVGLAWTENGGECMSVEVLLIDGKGTMQITGQVGEVMQESAQAALSYIKSRARELGVGRERLEKTDIHIHIPEGAIPKDGPSAGITMATALASALSGRPVRHDVGMTGEITLRGKVLPVGGVREKVVAAYRLKLRTVLLPEKN